MDWDVIAPMIVVVTITLTVAGVLILRPLTKRLGDLIEATARDKRVGAKDAEGARLAEMISRLTDRIETLEERQDFAERILSSVDRPNAESQGRLSRSDS